MYCLSYTSYIYSIAAALRLTASILGLPLARTVHQSSGLNIHANQLTCPPQTTFSLTSKVLSLCFCSYHLQANVLQAGKTSCTSRFCPTCMYAQSMSHMHQHYAMQNGFHKCLLNSAKPNHTGQYDLHIHQILLRIGNLHVLCYLLISAKRPRHCRER